MKLNLKKRKTVKALVLDDKADELGQEYSIMSERVKNDACAVARVKEEIKSFAASKGSTEEKLTVVLGRKFEVGFISKDAPMNIDDKKAREILTAKQYGEICDLVINREKLMKAVEQKKISYADFKKLLIQGEPTKVIHVKRRSHKQHED